jgi:hypothetical protein
MFNYQCSSKYNCIFSLNIASIGIGRILNILSGKGIKKMFNYQCSIIPSDQVIRAGNVQVNTIAFYIEHCPDWHRKNIEYFIR